MKKVTGIGIQRKVRKFNKGLRKNQCQDFLNNAVQIRNKRGNGKKIWMRVKVLVIKRSSKMVSEVIMREGKLITNKKNIEKIWKNFISKCLEANHRT